MDDHLPGIENIFKRKSGRLKRILSMSKNTNQSESNVDLPSTISGGTSLNDGTCELLCL